MAASKAQSCREGTTIQFRRVVVKVTGESFAAVGTSGLDPQHVDSLADKFVSAVRLGAQIAVVVGGGNMVRGASLSAWTSVRPVVAHQMGMTATVINGLSLAEALRAKGQPAVLTCSFPIGSFAELYSPQTAQEHLEAGKVVILAGGTGNAFVTTDTCAAIRSADLRADALLKATKVDAVYSDDPVVNPNAEKYADLSFDQAIDKQLGIMDLAAMVICRQAGIPVIVFDFQVDDSIAAVLTGALRGTKIST